MIMLAFGYSLFSPTKSSPGAAQRAAIGCSALLSLFQFTFCSVPLFSQE
jgi:hypothetical protein